MISAKKLMAENLIDGKYKVVKEGFIFDDVICYLEIDDGVWLFTNKSGNHQVLPRLSFEDALALTIKDGFYSHIAKTAISLWTVNDEVEKNRIINLVESIVLCNVIRPDI